MGIPLLVALATLAWGIGPASARDEATDASEAAEAAEAYDVYEEDEVYETDEAAEADEAAEVDEAIEADDAAEASAAADGRAPLTEAEHKGIEQLVVTAKRGSQDLQKIPESISSFSSEALLGQGLTDFNTLQYNVPSLFSGDGLSKITLRGVGSEIVGPGVDPGFAVHINNVFSARETTGRIDYFDIERIDVLRGPQGTLWGRNSTGGAINIITKRPEYEFDSNADVEYARFDKGRNGVRIRGMLNGPLFEGALAARVAFIANYHDGFMLNESENNRQWVNDAQVGTIRASVNWQPREDVSVDFIGGWLRLKHAGPSRKFDGDYFTPPGTTWVGAGPGYDFDDPGGFGVALPNPDDPYLGTADERKRQYSTVWTATILVGWEADHFKLDSITGYQSTDFTEWRDQDTSSLAISTMDLTDKSRQVSQEFLLNSTWDFPVDATLGTIYQYDWTPRTELKFPNAQNTAESVKWILLSVFPGDGGQPTTLVDGCDPVTRSGCPDDSIFQLREDFINAKAEVKNHVFGLYGNFSWEVIDHLTLQVGGRYSYTRRDWNDQTLAQNFAGSIAPFGAQILQKGVHQTHSWSAGTWKVSLDYQLAEEHLLWTSVGTGARAGGFNFAEEQPFGDERILAVEAGTKSMFFEDRLMLNLTGFWYDWEDPQIAGFANSLPITTNAPSAISYGIELEWRALPVDDLALNGTFGWLEAFYNEDHFAGDQTLPDFDEPNPANRVTPINLKGNRIPRSPRFTVSVGAQYTFDFGRWGVVIPRVDFYYRDEINFRQFGNPKDVEGSYTRTDARIIWRADDGTWWAEVFGRNLENNAVKTNQEIVASIYRVHYYDAPINGGFRVGYNFR